MPRQLVVDLNYECNANCNYCRWNASSTVSRSSITLEECLAPETVLRVLKIERIVLSGGEPLINKNIHRIIEYYRESGIKDIVLMTSGLNGSRMAIESLVDVGLRRIVFSIDSLEKECLRKTRGYSEQQVERIAQSLNEAIELRNKQKIEIGINCVISKANIDISNLVSLVTFSNEHNIDCLKFSPVFDDGYVSRNNPGLLLKREDIDRVDIVAKWLNSHCSVPSNPSHFWSEVKWILQGNSLDASYCKLDIYGALLIKGTLLFCAWLEGASYGNMKKTISTSQVEENISSFKQAKKRCTTGFQCFCLQRINHDWNIPQN